MSQSGISRQAIIPPGTFIEELQGDLGAPVGGAIVNILGHGTIAPATITNSGAIFTGDGVSTLSATFNYINIPDGVVGNPNGRLYQTSPFNGIRVFYHNGNGLGTDNAFFGIDAGATAQSDATISGGNTGVGQGSLASLAPGASDNSALGAGAGGGITSGSENIAIGAHTYPTANPSGSRNTIIGAAAGGNLTTGASNNIFIGYGIPGSVGIDNSTLRIGSGDGFGNGLITRAFIAGIDGVNIGSVAKVVTMATGSTNQLGTATITAGTGITITPGANLITVSVSALVGQTITGNSGGAIPPTLGNWNLVTANSTAKFVGAGSTLTLDFSLSNLILGNNGSTITVGAANDGFGLGVLQNITSGSSNSAFGNASLQNVTTGSQNSCYGASSGTAINTGGNNTLIGYQSGLLLQSGNSSVALGYQAGSAWGAAVSNNIAIGSIGAVADSARIRIGTNGTHTTAFFAGIDGVNVGSVAKVVTMASDQLGTATITAGAGIVVTPGANTITISSIGEGLTWSVITADQTAVVENGYFCNKAGTLALTLPTTSAVGDVIEVTNENTALGVQFTQAAGQQILIGNTNTTLGATGTLTSSAVGDTLKIVCKTANTIWRVTSMVGNWTPA